MKNREILRPRRSAGFTLIELLVVIATLAGLVAILAPALRSSRQFAYRVVCGAHLRAVGQALAVYDQDTERSPPYYDRWGPDKQTYETKYLEPWITYVTHHRDELDAGKEMIPLQLGLLYSSRYLETPKAYYCPAQPRMGSREVYSLSYYTEDGRYPWGTHLPVKTNGEPDDKIRTSYNYWLHGERTLLRIPTRPVLLDQIQHWNSLGHLKAGGEPAGINAFFGDGHVRFSTGRRIFEPALWNGGPEAGPWDGPGNSVEHFVDILNLLEH